MPPRLRTTFLLAAVILAGVAAEAQAQARYSGTGVGFQVGAPTGFSLRLYDRTPPAGDFYDILAAWDLEDSFFINVHGLRERRIRASLLNYFYGPGVLFGFDERGGDTEVVIGVSFDVGLNYFVERFEIFMQLTPRFTLLERTTFDFGGGVGLRYYL